MAGSGMWLLRKIVHNDAMQHDPPEIYGWRVYMLAFSVSGAILPVDTPQGLAVHALIRRQACFGAMCFGWDSGVIGGVIVLP